MKSQRQRYQLLRRELARTAEWYWLALAQDCAPGVLADRARQLASAALRLYIFEQGRRSKK
jgi:hypothetical protein